MKQMKIRPSKEQQRRKSLRHAEGYVASVAIGIPSGGEEEMDDDDNDDNDDYDDADHESMIKAEGEVGMIDLMGLMLSVRREMCLGKKKIYDKLRIDVKAELKITTMKMTEVEVKMKIMEDCFQVSKMEDVED